MALSPDVTQYSDLVLYDSDPAEEAALGVADQQAVWPEWRPRVGTPETTLIDTLCVRVSEIGYSLNRLTGATIQTLANLDGYERLAGAPATTTIRFTVNTDAGIDLPGGILVSVDMGDGTVSTFTTDAPAVVFPGDTTTDVDATAVDVGSGPNGIVAGTAVAVLTPLVFIDSAVTTADVDGGEDEEDDIAWLSRWVTWRQSATSTLVRPSQFEIAALSTAGIFRARAVNAYDPGSGNLPGEDGGHITVAVLGAGGATVSSPVKTALLADLQARASVDLTIHITNPTVTAVNVTATVKAAPDAVDLSAAVAAALQQYLSTDTWAWGSTVRHSRLVEVIQDVPGVEYVVAGHPTTPAGDVALAGAAPLPTLGTLTLTVTL